MIENAVNPSSERELLLLALAFPPEQQQAFLDNACKGDQKLRDRLSALLQCAQAESAFMDGPAVAMNQTTPMKSAVPGMRIDRYKLMEQIGEGGMGVVFVAEQAEPVRRTVALKLIKPGMDTKQVIARFEAERQALALMDHPNIARVLDAGTTDAGLPYFVMELVRGLPITDYCDKAKLSPIDRLQLFMTVCSAVQHAHLKGIIHRDLKPNNILVTLHDGVPVVKVIDFGVAKALHQQLTQHTLYTALNQVMGTPMYMSPEQLELSGLDIDTRTDVYSLGVLLYELLTGVPPFEREELYKSGFDELRRIIREQDPPRPSDRITTLDEKAKSTNATRRGLDNRSFAKTIRGELDWIVMKALEKDRNRRYESASAMAADVHRYLNHEQVQACPPSNWYRWQKYARRHRVLLSTAGIIVVAVSLGLAGTALQAFRAMKAEGNYKNLFEKEARVRADAQAYSVKAELEAKRAKEGEIRAAEESTRANDVLDFLLDDLLAFGVIENQFAGAIDHPNANLQVRTLLDRAAPLIDKRFAERPQTAGSLHYTVGKAYYSLGNLSLAEFHLRNAVEIGTERVGAEHPGTHRARIALSQLLATVKKFDEAESLLVDSLRFCREKLTTDHQDTQDAMSAMVYLRFEQHRSHEVIDLARELVGIRLRLYGEEDRRTLAAQADLAAQYDRGKQHQAALELRTTILSIQERAFPASDPLVLSNLADIAVLQYEAGRLEVAQKLFKKVIDAYQQHGDENARELIRARANLARVLWHQDKVVEAEALINSSLLLASTKVNERDTLNLFLMQVMQECKQGLHNYPEAFELYQRRLKLTTDIYGENSVEHIKLIESSADIYHGLRKPKEEERARKEAVNLARNHLGLRHPTTRTCMNNLGVHYFKAKRHAEAKSLFDEVIRNASQEGDPDRVSLVMAWMNLASVQNATGKTDEACATLTKAIAFADSTIGTGHYQTAVCRVRLAGYVVASGAVKKDYPQAVNLYRKAVNTLVLCRGLNSPETLDAQGELAKSLYACGRGHEADSLLLEVYESRVKEYKANHDAVAYAMVRICEIYRNLKMNKKALGFHRRYSFDLAQAIGEGAVITQTAFQARIAQAESYLDIDDAELLARERLATLSKLPKANIAVVDLAKIALATQIVRKLNSVAIEEPQPNLAVEAGRLCDEVLSREPQGEPAKKAWADALRCKVQALLANDDFESAELEQRRLIQFLRRDSIGGVTLFIEVARLMRYLQQLDKAIEAETFGWSSLEEARARGEPEIVVHQYINMLIMCELVRPTAGASLDRLSAEVESLLASKQRTAAAPIFLVLNWAALSQRQLNVERVNALIAEVQEKKLNPLLDNDSGRQIALIRRMQGRDKDAQQSLRNQIAGIATQSKAPYQNQVYLFALHDLAGVLIDSNRLEEAERFLIEIQKAEHPDFPGSWRWYSATCMLGGCKSAKGEVAEADRLLQAGINGLNRKHRGGAIPYFELSMVNRRAYTLLVSHLEKQHRDEEAENWRTELMKWNQSANLQQAPSAP